MGEITEVPGQSLPRADVGAKPRAMGSAGERVWRGLARAVFWSFERGSWQYDLIVLAIIAFIFLSPRDWFQDRPTLQMTDLRHHQGVVEVGRGKTETSYLIDARLVESLAPIATEDAIREILRRRLGRPFTVKSMHAVRDRNNVVLGYTVVVSGGP